MRFPILGLFMLCVTLLLHSPAVAQSRDNQAGIGANAALKYWAGFALLPSLDDEQEKLLGDWRNVPFNATALSLIDRSRNSREYLFQGAKIDRCDWSLDYSQGVQLLMPHLVKSRTLAALVALDARHEFEQGHWKAGAEDVSALLRLARHLEMEPMMIQQLVAYSIERTAIDAAAPYLPELKTIMLQAATDLFDTSQSEATLTQMVVQEKQVVPIWLIRELKQAESRKSGSWIDVWKGVFGESPGAEQHFLRPANTLEETISLLEDLLPMYDELAKMTSLPWKEFDARYAEFVKNGASANRFFAEIIPAVGKFSDSQRRRVAQIALLKAALAVVEGGPDKVKTLKDPFGDGPFEYRTLDHGFELKSKFLIQDKPMTLTVGQGKRG